MMPVMAGIAELPAIAVGIGAFVDLQYQLFAVVEGFVFDGCHAVGDIQAPELAAAREGAAADAAQAVRQVGAFQRMAVIKGVPPQRSQPMMQVDPFQTAAAVESAVVHITDPLGRGQLSFSAAGQAEQQRVFRAVCQETALHPQKRMPRRQRDPAHHQASTERFVPKALQRRGKTDAFERAALGKRPVAHLDESFGKADLPQRGRACKRADSDLSRAGRHGIGVGPAAGRVPKQVFAASVKQYPALLIKPAAWYDVGYKRYD